MALGDIDLSKINIDLDKSLRDAAHEDDIAPDGFHAMKVENTHRFLGMWPKNFPPIEPNTPMYWLIDMLTTMITEHQMEPLKGRLKDHVEDVVAKEIHSAELQKQIVYYIDESVKAKMAEYFKLNEHREETIRSAFADELKDL